MPIMVEQTEDGRYIIVRKVQQVFNYGYDDHALAEEIAAKLRLDDRTEVDANFQKFEDYRAISFGSSTKGTAANNDPQVDAWFIHVNQK